MQTAGIQTEMESDQQPQHICMIICGGMQLISSIFFWKLKKDEGGLSSFSLLDSFLRSAVEVSGGQ